MKVTDTSQISALESGTLSEGGRAPAAQPSKTADRVSTDNSAKVAAAVAAVSGTAASGYTARLQSIEAAVKQGTYQPNPQEIAEQILDDAELAARLQAMFGQ
ncbi:MAG TPA: flagellar biosynthesis anti-sigma factor FlgM [Anaeromyxobacteraceae bacterium]|nr:flagellar biosynthesis anti-sigma factor FlgM [Anaeromyxobacteraceae bacterium]